MDIDSEFKELATSVTLASLSMKNTSSLIKFSLLWFGLL